MDDLNGLTWSATSSSASKPQGQSTANYYPSLQPTPPTTATKISPVQTPGTKPSTPQPAKSAGTDSFSNLVSFGSKTQTLSLQEQQQKLLTERRRQEEEKRKQYESNYGSAQLWDGLGARSGISSPASTPALSRGSTPAIPTSFGQPAAITSNVASTTADDDLFAAFNAETKVDASSHYPPPQTKRTDTPAASNNMMDLSDPSAWTSTGKYEASGFESLEDDSDPFGLGTMSQGRSQPPAPAPTSDDDDFLGDLGKPVEEVRRATRVVSPAPAPAPERPAKSQIPRETSREADPFDKAVGELVDMGFTAENARRALTESGSGLNIQAAVGWLLEDAHREAKEKAHGRTSATQRERRETPRESSTSRSRTEVSAPRTGENGRHAEGMRAQSRSPANGDVDLSKAAAQMGSNLFKTANSLWKTSQKKVQRAVADLQADGDPSQPRWMREAALDQPARGSEHAGMDRTDEAMMLEGGSRPMPRRARPAPQGQTHPSQPSSTGSRGASPSPSLSSRPTNRPAPPSDPRSRLTKQLAEEQSAQAYVSPARRKKTTPQPPREEPDLLFGDSEAASTPASRPQAAARPTPPSRPTPPQSVSKPSTPIPVRPKAPPRNVPPLSAPALASSTQHRLAGTDHFKRGDFAAAHTSYSTSLTALPETHPIAIVLLCNRALTGLKIGEPRSAVTDADRALSIIGVGRGENELIELSPQEKKGMKEFWGKALTRKAEALEQMERWKDAREVWQEAAEAGVGGATAIQGKQRCDKALAPKPPPKPTTQRPAAPPKPRVSALSDLALPSAQSSAAVNRLRAAHAAAEKADDEKFALSEAVDARISKWRDGRSENLRALLGALDAVLWEGSGWKKVGMHELLVNSKVKIVYMKAIAKVHPDKLPQDATTEMKMISASVFATLNEAWDKFKKENGM